MFDLNEEDRDQLEITKVQQQLEKEKALRAVDMDIEQSLQEDKLRMQEET